jgi:hypothetical protein
VIAAWADHACRHCGSRLLERRTDEVARPVYECGGCSLSVTGEPDKICGCGILPKPVRMAAGPRFYCTPNPDRCVASPAAIVVVFDEVRAS